MAQGAINHICENITKSLEAAKERRGAASSFCLLQRMVELLLLQICVCLSTCLPLLLKAAGAHMGKANTAGCLHSKLSLYFSFCCGTFQDRSSVGNGNQTNLQHLKCSHFFCILGQFPDKPLKFSKGIIMDNYYKEANDFSWKPERFQCPSDLPELRHQKGDTSCCPAVSTGKDSLWWQLMQTTQVLAQCWRSKARLPKGILWANKSRVQPQLSKQVTYQHCICPDATKSWICANSSLEIIHLQVFLSSQNILIHTEISAISASCQTS